MPFQLSPGVAVVEKDFSAIVPAVSSSRGAFAGPFAWGPVLAPTSITSENELVRLFGKPTDANAQAFFTAANFLSYTNSLLVTRTDSPTARNAVAIRSGSVQSITVTNAGSGYTTIPTISISLPDDTGGIPATAALRMTGGGVTGVTVTSGGAGYTSATVTFSAPQNPNGTVPTAHAVISGGAITGIVIDTAGSGYITPPTVTIAGNGGGALVGTVSISSFGVDFITITNPGSGYVNPPLVTISAPVSGTPATATSTITITGVKINNTNDYLQSFSDGQGVYGEFAARYPGSLGNSLLVSIVDGSNFATWAYKDYFDSAPGTSDYAANVGGSMDEVHVIVIDNDGKITGTIGTVLEKFPFASKAIDAKKPDGTNNYYKNVLNSRSEWVYWLDHPEEMNNWGQPASTSFDVLGNSVHTHALTGGVDSLTATDGALITAYNLFADDNQYDISLIPLGSVSTTVANAVISNVAETRLDCVVFASPRDVTSGDVIIGTGSAATNKIVAYRNALPSTSYAVMDSGFKYQYDRYNDVYRWVPLNGDTAGLCARTDYTNDPWFSPSGLNRGQIKNVVKLAHNPTKADRDILYKAGVNPVVSFPGEGTVLFGDKTLLAKPSAFDRINVRRLFIVMEKAIATAAKFQLFEFNDGFTRAQFKNLVEPFLRDVQGRRGITDFAVKCDETNNTGQVIDSNQFVADIFVKPNRSINFITLSFVAARSSISFTELGA